MLTYIPPHIRESPEIIIGDIDECSYADRTTGEKDAYQIRVDAMRFSDEFILTTIDKNAIPGCGETHDEEA